MKRLIAIATVVVFVFAVSSVYACGEKNSSAKASKTSYGSESGTKETKASAIESNSANVEATTANYKTVTVGSKSCCPAGVKAEKASVKKADTVNSYGRTYCPASKDYREMDNSDVKVNKMKAENSREEIRPAQASTGAASEVAVK
ncbi:MAG: hypothetical protein JSU85_15200 [Candidatus Zixiibacteriota bacterium]|nr:MAG: hypothetical protein JSU85_15200 [candidate division Zixibacteria bacterium]